MINHAETATLCAGPQTVAGPAHRSVVAVQNSGPGFGPSAPAQAGDVGGAEAQRSADLAARLLEANHRARNNLQLIVLLLLIEAGRLEPAARAVLEGLAAHVSAIGLIHNRLDATPQPGQVAFGAALRALCRQIGQAYGGLARITVDIDPAPWVMAAQTATLLSLVVNEVITNALKHAFPDRRRGSIAVALQAHAGVATLSITDDGVGFVASRTAGTGSQLIALLCDAAGATMQYQPMCEGGTRFIASFRI